MKGGAGGLGGDSSGPRLGLLGGSFDPIHWGHLFMGEAAADELRLARVIYMPAGVPPHKASGPVAAAAERLAMTRAALQTAARFDVSDFEISRDGPSYTIETVKELLSGANARTDLYLIVGSDILCELHTWRDYEELVSLVRIAVLRRPGFPPGGAGGLPKDRVTVLDTGDLSLNISSSTVRERVKEGRSIRYLVPDPVESYIRQNGLYLGA